MKRAFDAALILARTLYWSTDRDTRLNKLTVELRKSTRYHILVAWSSPPRLPAVYKQLYTAVNTALGKDLKEIAMQDLEENNTFGFFIQRINGWYSAIYNVREIASSSFDFPIKSRFKEEIIKEDGLTRYMYAINCRVIDFVRLMNRVPEENVPVYFWG